MNTYWDQFLIDYDKQLDSLSKRDMLESFYFYIKNDITECERIIYKK